MPRKRHREPALDGAKTEQRVACGDLNGCGLTVRQNDGIKHGQPGGKIRISAQNEDDGDSDPADSFYEGVQSGGKSGCAAPRPPGNLEIQNNDIRLPGHPQQLLQFVLPESV